MRSTSQKRLPMTVLYFLAVFIKKVMSDKFSMDEHDGQILLNHLPMI